MFGNKNDPKRCCVDVPTAGLRMHYHQCTKPVTCKRDGKKYCKIHDPVAVAAKDAERRKQWEKEWAESRKKNALHAAAPKLLELAKEVRDHLYTKQDIDRVRALAEEALAIADRGE